MPLESPRWNYFVRPDTTPVRKDHAGWAALIPLSRHQACQPVTSGTTIRLTYGDYFIAARKFLQQNQYEMLSGILSQHLRRAVNSKDILTINISIEKHGEFYHPARVDITLPESTASLVLNVAVSDSGKIYLAKEYHFLNKLNRDFLFSFIPKIYEKGTVYTKNSLELPMVVGEWLEGFHEFHLSLDRQDNRHKIVVWDSDRGHFFLTVDQTLALYKQIAKILTLYYNIDTFEQISSWHHAAGDFVVKLDNGPLDVKLISVRNYASLFKENELDERKPHVHFLLEALLLFFLNLTIRTRLDRVDGVGEIVWAEDMAVEGTVQGFFEGLALKPAVEGLPDNLTNCFKAFLLALSQDHLVDLCFALVAVFNPKAPEVPVVKRHLKKHANSLLKAIQLMTSKK